MGKTEKLIERLKSNPKDFTFDEDGIFIILHKPHPRKELLSYQIKQIIEILSEEGLI